MANRNKLEISRHFAAPRALVFKAWSSVEHIQRWFSPDGCSVPNAKVDFRPGGVFAVCMRLPDGKEHWCRGAFDTITPVDRLSFHATVEFEGKARFAVQTEVSFAEDDGGTLMSVRQDFDIHDPEFSTAVDGSAEGWRTTLDKLEREMARMQGERTVVHGDFTLHRVYDAPPARVFRALTDPAAKAKWFGSGGDYVVLRREMDIRPGGREVLQGRWHSGMVTNFEAFYFDVVLDHRLVYGL